MKSRVNLFGRDEICLRADRNKTSGTRLGVQLGTRTLDDTAMARRTIPIVEVLPAAAVARSPDPQVAENASVASERYHSGEVTTPDDHGYEGAWLGRFRPLAVMIAGPALGSRRSCDGAWEIARDRAPVLIVPLAAVAAAMRSGTACEDALWNHGLSGPGISTARARDVLRGAIVATL